MSDTGAPTRKQHRSRSHPKATKWSQKEDNLLLSLVKNSTHISWTELAPQFPGKTAQQISERWSKVVDPSLIKGGWTREEDETITTFVAQHGVKNWTKLAQLLPGRIGKQCRERWRNHLDPNNKSGPWAPEEDELLLALHEEYGNSWVKIAGFMPGRSDNNIKNRWNSTLKKRISNGTPTTTPTSDLQQPSQQEIIAFPSCTVSAAYQTPEKKKSITFEPPDSIPKPEWNDNQKSNDTQWGGLFDSPFMPKSPFSPFMMKASPFSPWNDNTMGSSSFFTPRIMRSPRFINDASLSQDLLHILDKE